MYAVSNEIPILDTVYDFKPFTSYPDKETLILNRNNIISLV